MKSKNFIFESETDWEIVGNGVRRQVMGYDEEIMLVKVDFQKDAVGYIHSHPHRQCTYVASGVFEFQIDELMEIVESGDSLYIEPDKKHGVKCLEAGMLIDVFNPVRKDFI